MFSYKYRLPIDSRYISQTASQMIRALLVLVLTGVLSVDALSAPPAAVAQETQEDRNSLVTRIEIVPGDVALPRGETVFFAVIAYDISDTPVNGVSVNWRAENSEGLQEGGITQDGSFTPHLPGTYIISATIGTLLAQTTVAVNEQPLMALAARIQGGARWDDTNFESAFGASNQRGRLTSALRGGFGDGVFSSSTAVVSLPGSGNFSFTVPIINAQGRGQHLSLNLVYNSRLWYKSGFDNLIFDIDGDWPAPGWSLGFGKIVATRNGEGMLIGPDGSRHSYRTVSQTLGEFTGRTDDGTFIDYEIQISENRFRSARAWYPNGLIMDYTALSANHRELFPTRITDAHGNLITITYRNNIGPQLHTITDTLGRTIVFHYDANELLTAITAPEYLGGTRQLIRLHYQRMQVQYGFFGSILTEATLPMIEAIYYPGTGSGYWFGDADSYSTYGMLVKISQQRGLAFSSASLNEQGTVTRGTVTRQWVYNYPLQPDSSLEDAPMFTTMTETWEGMTTSPAVTTYHVGRTPNGSPLSLSIRYPDGTSQFQNQYLSSNIRDRWREGLVYRYRRYEGSELVEDTNVAWERGYLGIPRQWRLEVTDASRQTTATEFSYGTLNQIEEVREYDYDGKTVLRRVTTEYVRDPRYIERRFFSLPRAITIYERDSTIPAARTEFYYDEYSLQPLRDNPGVVQYDQTYNTNAPPIWIPEECEEICQDEDRPPCERICYGDYWEPGFDERTRFRGNATRILTFVYTGAAYPDDVINQVRHYDITGNLIGLIDNCCQQREFEYTSATQYAYPTTVTRGAADTLSLARLTTTATYDFNTGLQLTATSASQRTTTFRHTPGSLELSAVFLSTGAWASYDYNYEALSIDETVHLPDGTSLGHYRRSFNGLGLLRRVQQQVGTTLWDVAEVQFDARGRLWKEGRPFQGGESDQTQYWSIFAYDALGRIKQVVAPDGSLSSRYYNDGFVPDGASGAPGQTIRQVDAWGRQRWLRLNALGQLVEVIEPRPEGDGDFAIEGNLGTQYAYDALDQLIRVQQGLQIREFRYDSLGRLTHQYLPERAHTLNDQGQYVGTARWSDVYRYDLYSNLISHTDARGVRTIYDYGNDPLNRLQRTYHDLSNAATSVLSTPEVQYEYMNHGDLTRLWRVTTQGVNTTEYTYDGEARLSAERQTLALHPNHPMVIQYTYDSLSRLESITYPAEYGYLQTGQSEIMNRNLHHEYDGAGRLGAIVEQIPDEPIRWNFASALNYNASGQLQSLVIGNDLSVSGLFEVYNFDPATGLLANQQITHYGTHRIDLLNITYDYLRGGSGRTGQLLRVFNHLDPEKNRYYEYDAVGRLLAEYGGNLVLGPDLSRHRWSYRYSYDRFGNRTGTSVEGRMPDGSELPPDGLSSLEFDQWTNHITNDGFQYDLAGNLIRAQRADGQWQVYEYDAAGRLVTVSLEEGRRQERYTYGADNRRLATTYSDFRSNGRISAISSTYYVWSGAHVLAEYASNGLPSPEGLVMTNPNWLRSNVYLGERLLATLSRGSPRPHVQYLHPDRLNIRLITTEQNTGAVEQMVLPFGTEFVPRSSGGTTRRFTSYDRSEGTGLDYAVNRFYDPQQGRFLQVDPIGMEANNIENPQSLNLYTYVINDPANGVDPLGLKCVDGRDTETGVGCSVVIGERIPPNPPIIVGDRTWDLRSISAGSTRAPVIPPERDRNEQHNNVCSAATASVSPEDPSHAAMGYQIDASGFSCLGACFGAFDVALGIYTNSEGLRGYMTLGGAFWGMTPGPNGVEASGGVGAGVGVSLQGFMGNANADQTKGWGRAFSSGVGPISGSYVRSSGAHTVYLGPGIGTSAVTVTPGVATYNTYTFMTPAVSFSDLLPKLPPDFYMPCKL
ncbi:MAG: hypothetical protein IT320_09290 [Anaerolineae bacterium]|nr:hypothetical protein [Anaerolineae bacterium]